VALTRRFFTSLARDFKDARPQSTDSREFGVWMQMVRITAEALAAQNSMFNYARFYEACGMPEPVVAAAAS